MLRIQDVKEHEDIIETTPIGGLHWMKTDALQTSVHSRIVLPSPGQGNFTAVYHAADFSESSHKGYDYYGIHVGQVDVLTFLAADGRTMSGHFVDCRKGSPTLHKELSLTFDGDPDRALVIERGIAHIFDNLLGMTTLNQPRLYVDFKNPDFISGFDVLNVPRGTSPDGFPVLQINRYRAPTWLCRLAVKAQRVQLKSGRVPVDHPFRFRVGNQIVTLTKRAQH